ncbi:hypothetical protein [Paraliomyxa miuraensis]|uniref:hypothetical protein n=1 Tax=Paraliomyxa miuraensis TaxID=376150 RepID=UPI0022584CB8|nr:hypothetical protein [Paraliomyxa miuraensis]MCX4241244.1 hypothetical protein [Paraliomyxa miuraensis]
MTIPPGRLGLLLAGTLLVGACGRESTPVPQSDGKIPEATPPMAITSPPTAPSADIGDAPLTHAKPSLSALGQAIVDALDANDEAALLALTVPKEEYERLFPALVSHPNMLRLGPTFAWQNQEAENRGDRATALRRHGGKGYAFTSLEPTAREERSGLVVYRKPRLTVTDAQGATHELRILGAVIEHPASQTFSILAFVD